MRENSIIGLLTRCIVSIFIITTTLGISLNFALANGWYISQIAETPEYTATPVIAVGENNVVHVVWTIGQQAGDKNSDLYYANSNNNWLPFKITNTANFETPSIFRRVRRSLVTNLVSTCGPRL